MTVIKEVVSVELGAAENDCEILDTVKRVVYGKVPTRHSPQTVMGTVNPTGWNKPHKYIIIEIHCLGEVYEAIYHNGSGNVAYDSFTTDNPALPFCRFNLKDENGAAWTVELTGAIVDGVQESVNDGEDMLSVIYVSAKSMTPLTKS
jgi:hypothetical protein